METEHGFQENGKGFVPLEDYTLFRWIQRYEQLMAICFKVKPTLALSYLNPQIPINGNR